MKVQTLVQINFYLSKCFMPKLLMFIVNISSDRDKLVDPMYRLEHQEEDLKKKKEAEPVLVRVQGLSDSRHSDDYALKRTLCDRLRVIQ
jgi:hypothetical protein